MRLKTLKNKNPTNQVSKVRKSKFIEQQALLLLKQMEHNNNNNNNENNGENSANSSFSEKNENKEIKKTNVDEIINSKPVNKTKKKKPKINFLYE